VLKKYPFPFCHQILGAAEKSVLTPAIFKRAKPRRELSRGCPEIKKLTLQTPPSTTAHTILLCECAADTLRIQAALSITLRVAQTDYQAEVLGV
jgi:hypothetical protein